MAEQSLLPLSGFRDFLPAEASAREALLSTIREVAGSYGYQVFDTPVLERDEVLSGRYGSEGEALRYRFEDHGKRQVGLRYDLTVPFARVLAKAVPTSEIRLPFRRLHTGLVWRADRPQAGRYREFMQCDFDMAGATGVLADAEVLSVAAAVFMKLGVKVQIRVNSRELTDILLTTITENTSSHASLYGLIDRTDKLTPEEYDEQLSVLGLTLEEQARARQLLSERSLSKLTQQVPAAGVVAEYLASVLDFVIGNESVEVLYDPTIVRGLSYYTGMVYECTLTDAKNIGSVGGGGRYDRQIGQFLGRDIPAVGGSFGLDRLIAGLEQLGALPGGVHLAQLAVLPLAGSEKEAWELARELRGAGVLVVNHPGGVAVGQMLGWSSSVASYAVVVGADEVAKQQFALRNLATRTEEFLSVEEIKQYLHDH